MAPNPFLDRSFHIRWSELKPELIAPAIETALAEAEAGLARIEAAPLPPEGSAPTFEDTFLALERATEALNEAWGKVSHLQSVADAPALREAHNQMLPLVSAFYARIPLRAALWARLKACAESPAAGALTGVRRRFLEETMADFREAGADLAPDRKARLEALQAELAQTTQTYAEHVLDATNAGELIVEDERRLAGLPERAKRMAQANATAKGLGSADHPAWRFTLQQPSLEPFLTYLEDDGLRRELWTAAAQVGAKAPYDNTALIERIVALRAEKAALLGKAHFADLVLSRRMAASGARALAFIEDLRGRCAEAFAREARELEEFKARETGQAAARLAPWELGFWSERLRRARYDFDEEALRPYFPVNRVMDGLFELVRRVFGLQVTARAAGEVEVWHPDVTFYDVRDAAGRAVGSFYADWYPREAKRGGAWMNQLITGGPGPQGRAPHLGLICGNLTPPAGGRAARLTHREVETIFHEFGHLLHHLLGEVEIKALNGTNVAWDFVEMPSQIMENWCWERESLDLVARHDETGATIPDELFDRLTAARHFRAAAATMRQVAFAKLDLLLHTRAEDFLGGGDPELKVRAAVADCLVPTEPPAPTILKRFTHVFSDPVGYAAGYYSYKWAEVLEADAFTRFRREGLFSAKVGADLVRAVLSRGNSAPAGDLFREFMGRDPDLTALLKRSGLAA
jgi:oligopeptidase A